MSVCGLAGLETPPLPVGTKTPGGPKRVALARLIVVELHAHATL